MRDETGPLHEGFENTSSSAPTYRAVPLVLIEILSSVVLQWTYSPSRKLGSVWSK